jgi:hypothetical protein
MYQIKVPKPRPVRNNGTPPPTGTTIPSPVGYSQPGGGSSNGFGSAIGGAIGARMRTTTPLPPAHQVTTEDVLNALSRYGNDPSGMAAAMQSGMISPSMAPSVDIGAVLAPYVAATNSANAQAKAGTAQLDALKGDAAKIQAQTQSADAAKLAALQQVAAAAAHERQAQTSAATSAATQSLGVQGVDPRLAAQIAAQGAQQTNSNSVMAALANQRIANQKPGDQSQQQLQSEAMAGSDQAARQTLNQNLSNILNVIGLDKAKAQSAAEQQNAQIAAQNAASANSAAAHNAAWALQVQQAHQSNLLNQASAIDKLIGGMANGGHDTTIRDNAVKYAAAYGGGGSQAGQLFNDLTQRHTTLAAAEADLAGGMHDQKWGGDPQHLANLTHIGGAQQHLINTWLQQYYGGTQGLSSDALSRIRAYFTSMGYPTTSLR